MIKPKVLFLCTGNSCRTQMAEAFLRDLAGDRFEITSAGAEATQLDPEAVQARPELGIDMSTQRPKKVDGFLGQRFSYVISPVRSRAGRNLSDLSRRNLAAEVGTRRSGSCSCARRAINRSSTRAESDSTEGGRVR